MRQVGRLWNKHPFLAKVSVKLGASLSVDEPVPRKINVLNDKNESVQVVKVKCSAGTTAAITSQGNVYMFGKKYK